MKILHFADVHLDRPFVGMDRDAARRRRNELREALERCLAAAREHAVDLVTVAGDLWEDEHVTPDTRAFVAHELGRLAPVPVLIACGNHDPLVAGGHWRRTAWPSNVRVLEGGDPAEVRHGGVSVWGASWSGQGLDISYLQPVQAGHAERRFRVPDDGRRHLLLLHGTLRSVPTFLAGEGVEAYAPFEPADVERCGFALCLAGHLHGGFHQGPVVYPGSPEPLGWAERGRHCYALIEVAEDRLDVRLEPVNRRRYEERSVDCTGAASSAEIAVRVARELVDDDPGGLCLRVRLAGQVAPECVVDVDALAAPHRERYAALVLRDGTAPEHDFESLARQPTAAGHFVRALGERLADAPDEETREFLRLAREAGLNAVHGRPDVIRVD